jgi:hypothetical protein
VSTMETMKCGECGCNAANLKVMSKDAFDGYSRIEITCLNCGSKTMLRPFTAFVVDRDYDHERGDFTAGWNDDGQDHNVLDKARRQVLEESIGVKTVGPLPELTPEAEAKAVELVEKWRDDGEVW